MKDAAINMGPNEQKPVPPTVRPPASNPGAAGTGVTHPSMDHKVVATAKDFAAAAGGKRD